MFHAGDAESHTFRTARTGVARHGLSGRAQHPSTAPSGRAAAPRRAAAPGRGSADAFVESGALSVADLCALRAAGALTSKLLTWNANALSAARPSAAAGRAGGAGARER